MAGCGHPALRMDFKWGRRAASPLAAVEACGGGKLPGRDESLPYELTAKGIWHRVAGRACPAPARGVDGKMENGAKLGGGACIILLQAL